MDPSWDPDMGDSSDNDSTRTYSTEPKQPTSPDPEWTDVPINTDIAEKHLQVECGIADMISRHSDSAFVVGLMTPHHLLSPVPSVRAASLAEAIRRKTRMLMEMSDMQAGEWCVENGVLLGTHLECLHRKLHEWSELSSDLRDYEAGVE
jgi:hypothetical protein